MSKTAPPQQAKIYQRQVAADEVLVLDLDLAKEMLYGTQRRRDSKVVRDAMTILELALPTILVRGFTMAKLGNAWLERECGLSYRDAVEAKQRLRDRGIISLAERSKAGERVATWSISPQVVRREKRQFAGLGHLYWYWCEALGPARAKRLWATCYLNADPRRTPKKLLIAAHALTDEDWALIEEGDEHPASSI